MLLEVSKADPSAKGGRWALACACPSALCPVIAAKAVLKATAGQGPEAYAVINLRGQPATKNEGIAEMKAMAAAAGLKGHFTGHSLRAIGAQRVAIAGVGEHRIATFGRWSSAAFKLYGRDAVLGCNGGNLARLVVQVGAGKVRVRAVQKIMEGAHGLGCEACGVYENRVRPTRCPC